MRLNYNPKDVEIFFGGKKIEGFANGIFIYSSKIESKLMNHELVIPVVVEIDWETILTKFIDFFVEQKQMQAAMLVKWKKVCLYQNNLGDL